jgi:hypothetical protein
MIIPVFITIGLLAVIDGFQVPVSRSHVGRRTLLSQPGNRHSMSSNAVSVISSNQDLLPGIAAIEESNEELQKLLVGLRDKPYFRLYSVDILASCEYMPQELFECYTESCEIYPIDEEEVRQIDLFCVILAVLISYSAFLDTTCTPNR